MEIDYQELDRKANPGAFSEYDAEVLVPELLKLKPGEIYLEIGVDKGKSLSIAKMVVPDGVEVHGVDIQVDPGVPGTHFTQGDSVEVAKAFNKEISVIFIDGDHSYEGCKRDIEAWYPKMKKGGVMLFHDCDESSPGVVYAVFEFAYKNREEIKGIFLYKYNHKNTSMCKLTL